MNADHGQPCLGKDDGFDEVHVSPNSGLCRISMGIGMALTCIWRLLHDVFSSVSYEKSTKPSAGISLQLCTTL